MFPQQKLARRRKLLGIPKTTRIHELLLRIFVFLVAIAISNSAFAEIPHFELKSFIESERSAGRVPDIKAKFGLDFCGSDFTQLDLKDVDLSNTKLQNAKFTSANLYGVDLSGSCLHFSQFIKADMRKVNFKNATLDRCDFEQSDLRGCIGFGTKRIPTTWVEANGVDLCGTDLRNSDLSRIRLIHANLSNADLRGTTLAETDLHGANLEGVKVENTLLINSKLSDKQRDFLSQNGAIATGKDMEHAVARGMKFEKARLEHANLSGLNLNGANFNKAWLHTSNLHGTQLIGSALDGSFLSYSNVERTNLQKANVRKAKMWRANIKNANLSQADFSESDLSGSTFVNSNLSYCNLSKAKLKEAEFVRCNLSGTVFAGAKLKSVLFENNHGLSKTQERKLKWKAMRWRHNLIGLISKLLEKSYGYVVAVLFCFVCIGLFLWFKITPKPTIWWMVTICDLMCTVPLAGILLLLLSGTGTVVQFNAGSEFHMAFWSFWVNVFIPFLLFTLIASGVSLIASLILAILLIKGAILENKAKLGFYVLSSTCYTFFTLYIFLQFAPTA